MLFSSTNCYDFPKGSYSCVSTFLCSEALEVKCGEHNSKVVCLEARLTLGATSDKINGAWTILFFEGN